MEEWRMFHLIFLRKKVKKKKSKTLKMWGRFCVCALPTSCDLPLRSEPGNLPWNASADRARSRSEPIGDRGGRSHPSRQLKFEIAAAPCGNTEWNKKYWPSSLTVHGQHFQLWRKQPVQFVASVVSLPAYRFSFTICKTLTESDDGLIRWKLLWSLHRELVLQCIWCITTFSICSRAKSTIEEDDDDR